MVIGSHEPEDRTLLNREIAERGLHPVPLPDFWRAPETFFFDSDYRRYVERYPWGAFVTASHRKEKHGFSAVCVGDHSVPDGRTVDADGGEHRLQDTWPWYGALLERAATQAPLVPECMGRHTPRAVPCDGGVYGGSAYVEGPCSWREPCARLKAWCAAKKVPAEQVLRGKSAEALMGFIDTLPVYELPPVDLQAAVDRIRKGGKALAPRRRPALALGKAGGKRSVLVGEALAHREALLLDVITQILDGIATRLGRPCAVSKDDAAPGELFLSDKLHVGMKRHPSDWVTLYCKGSVLPDGRVDGRSTGIVRVIIMPMIMMLDVEFGATDLAPPLARSFPGRLQAPKLSRSSAGKGTFLSRLRLEDDLDIPVVIEVATQLCLQGFIPLPPMERRAEVA